MKSPIRVLILDCHQERLDSLQLMLENASRAGWRLPEFITACSSLMSPQEFHSADVLLWFPGSVQGGIENLSPILLPGTRPLPLVAVIPENNPQTGQKAEEAGADVILTANELSGHVLAHALLQALKAHHLESELEDFHSNLTEIIQTRTTDQYLQLADNAKELILIHSMEGKINYVNPAVISATGYSRDDFQQMFVNEFFAADMNGSMEVRRQKRLSGSKDRYYYEHECITASGKRLPLEISSIPLDYSNRTSDILLLCRDISSRKEAELALRERTQHLEALRNFELTLTSDLKLEDLLYSVVSQAAELVNADDGGISLYRPLIDRLEFSVHTSTEKIPEDTLLEKGEGLAGRVWEIGKGVIIDDYHNWPHKAKIWTEFLRNAALAGVPVSWGNEFLGVLEVLRRDGPPFTESDLQLLELFAPQAAIAIHNTTLFQSMNQRVAEFKAIQRASLELTSNLELDLVLSTVLESALGLIPADDAHIFLYEKGELKFGAALFGGEKQKQPYANPRSDGLTYTVAKSGKRLVVNNVKDHPIFHDQNWVGAILGLPLKIGEVVHGVMNVAFERPHTFTEDELRVLEFLADQAAIAIHNAHLYEKAQTELSERKRAEIALQESEERFKSLFKRIPVGLYTTTPDGKIIDGNPALVDMLRFPDEESLHNLDVTTLYVNPEDRNHEKRLLENDGIVQAYEMQLRRKDGEVIWVQDTTRGVKDPEGNILYYQGSLEEITERKMMEEAIKHMATHDALTGLPNRRLFNDRIELEMAHAKRQQTYLAVLLLDLDNFKDVNDSLGHSVGDLVLIEVGTRLQDILRESDTVARMGGDEFMIILPEIEVKKNIEGTIKRVLETISQPITIQDYIIELKTSIGIAFYPDDGNDVDTLIKNADIAMYRAKDLGGNTFHYTRM